MPEILETSPVPEATIAKNSETTEEVSNSELEIMRTTKPGLKRFVLILSVLLSFLLGLPFLLKSIEIYRAPLPFRDIDSLSTAIESSPLLFPCHFRAIFVNFDYDVSSSPAIAGQLAHSIYTRMRSFVSKPPVCGTCNDNFTVSVTVDSYSNCIYSDNSDYSLKWECGALDRFKIYEQLNRAIVDEDFDEYLESLLHSRDSKVYTVVVVNGAEEARAVVGKYRHAWIMSPALEGKDAVENVAETFVNVFVNGGKEEGSIHGEFMPVGADGRIVLSFNLLNADPHDWIYDWDFQEIDELLLAPIVKALRPLADISVESQVLYHTPKSSFSYWDVKQESYIFSTKDLPFFVNSNEWHLDTSTAAGGRSKVLQFVVYVPSAKECPLQLQLQDGQISLTNGFISPMWGGVVVWNPPACLRGLENSRRKISSEDLKKVFEVFLGQLRQLFGLKSESLYIGGRGTYIILPSERGFTDWELDVLSRQHTCFNLLQCGTTLGSLSRLVQSLPRMIIREEIGKQVKFSLEAANLSLRNASLGSYDASAVSSRQARSLAEDAFYHPSMMSVSYYSFEHCFAVYSPFFLPVSLHVLLAVLREWKRYRQENKRCLAGKTKQK